MIIYRLTDRIPVQIGELTFWLAPLSASQKSELLSLVTVHAGEERVKPMEVALRCVSMSLKKLEGVKTADGEPYELSFDPSGNLSRECAEEIFGLDGAEKMLLVCKEFAFSELKDPKLEGVVVDFSKVHTLKKNVLAESPAS